MKARLLQSDHLQNREKRQAGLFGFVMRWAARCLMLIALGFLLIVLIGPFFPRNQENLHGSALRPSFQFGNLEYDVFADVPGENPHAYALAYLKTRGMIKGFEDGSFHPDEMMNRAVFMKMLSESLRAYPHRLRYGYCFSDVQGDWYAPYVCYGKGNGWIEEGDEFGPDSEVTRAFAVKTLMRAFDVETANADEPSHYRDVSAEDLPYVVAAEKKGWFDGFIVGSEFRPDAPMHRVEIAELLFRIILTEKPAS